MSPPPAINFGKALPPVPATAPVKKHVNFTSSTLERTAEIEINHSPSPVKFRAGSEMPNGAVVYPTLQPNVQYPELSQEDETPAASPSRRLTFGGEAVNQPRHFSFDSGKSINFGKSSRVPSEEIDSGALLTQFRPCIYWYNPHGSEE